MTLRSQRPEIRGVILALLIATAAGACSNQPTQQAAPKMASPTTPAASASPASASPTATDAPIPNTPSPFDALPESVRAELDKPFTGDFAEMVKRRAIRVGVTFNRTHYFID